MRVADFDFDLPPERIAQEPRARGASRLLVVDRGARSWREVAMTDLPRLLTPGDRLVVNDTRVFPARLLGRRDLASAPLRRSSPELGFAERRRPSGGAAECLLLERLDDTHWHALVHPGQKLKAGSRVIVEDSARAPGVALHIEILERRFFGRRLIELTATGAESVDAAIDALGHVPLPPYIHRADTADDRERYQTVYATARGSVAAPTAGLHFDAPLLAALEAAGIARTAITLHVGYGTFKPVRAEVVEDHRVDAEPYVISEAAAGDIAATRAGGHRIVAVGTTTTRALETAAAEDGIVRADSGASELFIHPGYQFRVVDALLTNFHLPRSSLLMLVAAFAGRELVLDAYRDAIARGFAFYSYGDAMLVV